MIVGRSNSDEFHQIAHYELIDYNAIYPKPNCSGAIFPYTPTVPPPATPSYPSVEPVDLAYAPVQFGAFTKDFFMLPTTFDSTDQYYTVLRSPCDYGDPSAPEVSAQLELPGMSDSFTCATTLRSSKSIYQSYMPTPTPGITPTPTP